MLDGKRRPVAFGLTLSQYLSRPLLAACAVVFLTGAACDETSSPRWMTDELRADFRATGLSSGVTRVRASLDTLLSDVRLKGGDRLIGRVKDPVSGEVVDRKLKFRKTSDDIRYQRLYEGNAQGTEIEIDFDRERTGEVSALDSIVRLPAPFSLHWVSSLSTLEPAALDFSRGGPEDRFLVWDLAEGDEFETGDSLRFEVTGNCIETYSGTIDWQRGEDSLELTGVLRDLAPPMDGRSCPLEVEIRLVRDGYIDSSFRRGDFVGEQLRSLTLFARP